MKFSNIKVLIVEDEDLIRLNLELFLENNGFTVFSTLTGQEALLLLDKEKIDFAIIDIRLPDIDGNTLILKANTIQPNIQFLIHTGSIEYKLPQKLMDMGILNDNVFIKPVNDMNGFCDAIEKLINK